LAECINSHHESQASFTDLPEDGDSPYTGYMVKLIAFLGNKGIQYRKTRHNCGWLLSDALVSYINSTAIWQEKFHAQWQKANISGQSVILLKPVLFMNESGKSIGEANRYFSIEPQETIVVHDDVELSFGTCRLQFGGGLAGHNGLRSTVQHLGSDRFLRLRIGIGRPQHGDIASFVLGRFSPEEEMKLPIIWEKCIELIETFITRQCKLENLPTQKDIF
jgi:peptidyl-tRNA hydrolase, PTH1 family